MKSLCFTCLPIDNTCPRICHQARGTRVTDSCRGQLQDSCRSRCPCGSGLCPGARLSVLRENPNQAGAASLALPAAVCLETRRTLSTHKEIGFLWKMESGSRHKSLATRLCALRSGLQSAAGAAGSRRVLLRAARPLVPAARGPSNFQTPFGSSPANVQKHYSDVSLGCWVETGGRADCSGWWRPGPGREPGKGVGVRLESGVWRCC